MEEEQNERIMKKTFFSIVDMLRWMDSYENDCKKSVHVDYDDKFHLLFTGIVEEPEPKKPKVWKQVHQEEAMHGRRRFRTTIEEFTDE